MTQPQGHPLISTSTGGVWRTRSDPGSIALRLSGPFVWIPAAFLALIVAAGASFFGMFYMGFFLAPAIAYLGVSFLELIMRSLRERRARIVLSYLDHAVRLNLPLPVFLVAAERSERGATRRRLADIRRYLASGTTVSVAIEAGLPELPPRWAALISAGEQNGNVTDALARIVDEDVRARETTPPELGIMRRGYLATVMLASIFLVSGIMVFVIPKFREIFKDFKTTLPSMTESLMSFSDWFANEWGWFLVVPPAFIFLIFLLARTLRKAFVPAWPPLIPSWWFQWILWRLPVARTMMRDRAMGDICRVIADGLRQRRSLVETLLTARTLELPEPMRRRVDAWHTNLLAGQDPASAATAAHMPDLCVQFLRSLQTQGGPTAAGDAARPDLMEFLANYYRTRFSRAVVVFRAAIEPVVVLAMALFVGYIVIALFLPLVKLIQSVSGGPGDVL